MEIFAVLAIILLSAHGVVLSHGGLRTVSQRSLMTFATVEESANYVASELRAVDCSEAAVVSLEEITASMECSNQFRKHFVRSDRIGVKTVVVFSVRLSSMCEGCFDVEMISGVLNEQQFVPQWQHGNEVVTTLQATQDMEESVTAWLERIATDDRF